MAIAAWGLVNLAPQGAASATTASKVVVCHATASDTNPWVRIEVSENALPAHLGEVGNSHQRQRSLGRDDFVWSEDYDQDCLPIPVAEPVRVICSGVDSMPAPVRAVADDGTITSIPCPEIHTEVSLPRGVHRIICGQGTLDAPYWQEYRLTATGRSYGVNCYSEETVDLGVQGGRLQVVCPAEGSVSVYRWGLLGGLRAVPMACTPGLVAPTPQNPLGSWTEAIDWNTANVGAPGFLLCPAAGSLSLYYLGEGQPIDSSTAMTSFPCTAGQKLDATRVVLTV